MANSTQGGSPARGPSKKLRSKKLKKRVKSESTAWLEVSREYETLGQKHPIVTCLHCEEQWVSNEKKRVVKHLTVCKRLPDRLWKAWQPHRISSEEPEPFSMPKTRNSGDCSAGYTGGIQWMSAAYHERAVKACSRWLFAAGLPLSTVDNPAFREFMAMLAPAFTPPSRHHLTHKLSHCGRITVVTDGWTNPRGESITNYLAITPEGAVFVKSECTEDNRHTSENLAAAMESVLEDIGAENVVAVTTDNAANMVGMRSMITASHPHIQGIGCGSHHINILMNRLTSHTLAPPHVKKAYKDSLEVVKYGKDHGNFTAQLVKLAEVSGVEFWAWRLPGKTRWQGKFYMAECLIKNMLVLQRIAFNDSNVLTERPKAKERDAWKSVKMKLCDPLFWQATQQFADLRRPFVQVCISLESDTVKLSHVYANYRWLLSETMDNELVENDDLRDLILQRFDKAYHPLMLIAYLADPRQRAERPIFIELDEIIALQEWLLKSYCWGDEQRCADLLAHLILLRDRQGFFHDAIRWNGYRSLTAIQWWQSYWFGDCQDLSHLCIMALAIAPTSGAAERNWSAHGFIHNLKRNRLSHDIVNKLVYLFWNLKLKYEWTNDYMDVDMESLDDIDMAD